MGFSETLKKIASLVGASKKPVEPLASDTFYTPEDEAYIDACEARAKALGLKEPCCPPFTCHGCCHSEAEPGDESYQIHEKIFHPEVHEEKEDGLFFCQNKECKAVNNKKGPCIVCGSETKGDWEQ